jgi:type IV pilus assembly protein PilE
MSKIVELRPNRSTAARLADGFTLIELMIAVAIIAVLAAVALPSYLEYVKKSRRSDAWALLQNAALAQEKWRISNTTYSSANGNLTAVCPASGVCFSPSRYYSLDATTVPATATSYTLVANAVSGSSQSTDVGCQAITLTHAAGVIQRTPTSCWKN